MEYNNTYIYRPCTLLYNCMDQFSTVQVCILNYLYLFTYTIYFLQYCDNETPSLWLCYLFYMEVCLETISTLSADSSLVIVVCIGLKIEHYILIHGWSCLSRSKNRTLHFDIWLELSLLV